MQGLALVDWYNFRRRDQNSKADLELVTLTIVEQVSCAFAALFPNARELDLRLYGGWITEQGWPSAMRRGCMSCCQYCAAGATA